MRRLTWVIGWLLVVAAFGRADVIVGTINTGPNLFPFGTGFFTYSGEYQQVYTRRAFPGAVVITGLKFASAAGYAGTSTILATISLSTTTTASVAKMSTDYAANKGADFTQVFSGTLTYTALGNDTFDLSFPTTAFTYDPARGNLLLDVVIGSITGATIMFDANSDSVTSRVYNGGGFGAPTFDRGYGLVTDFVTSASGTYSNLTAFPVPTADSGPRNITLGPDGALWFTEAGANRIGRVTILGKFTEYPVATPDSEPYGITAGPDGALWFTEYRGNKIGRITSTGSISEYPIPTPGSDSQGITTGPDGALWFAEAQGSGNGKIGRITTAGVISEYPVPTARSQATGIALGPDAALWFTEWNANKIGRIDTSGVITEFPLPTASNPYWITAGPDGALWFTEQTGNNIGRIATSGTITEYSVPTAECAPWGITGAPDGALWFTELNGNKIGRITTGGAITEYAVPASLSTPAGIALRPGLGALWITAMNGNAVGSAPACGLGLSASFAGHTLTTNFNLGINVPAVWTIVANDASLLSKNIPGVAPPRPFSFNWQPFPPARDIVVTSTLSQRAALCSEWTTVNNAP